ncbi:hypothetical protein BD289DRAFT_449123 [Coniella lustricola]|uniref:Autophagy-related protein 33 n=1 Tax=Coniella lustricola TaxID=2025994 RepID=A0A2T3ANM5_9PEZI|nr:hypothetical protein BD289DRAFT_449123 [Coniella lustricola]
MTSRGVSVLKFVGTVSLGLLTGVSYSLSALTVPTLLDLPSASTASRAFKTLSSTARRHMRSIAGVSSTAFLLAYALSPRAFRHPYLLYASLLAVVSQVTLYNSYMPWLSLTPKRASSGSNSSSSASATAASKPSRKEHSATRRMEMSYDMVGSDIHSEGTLDSASDKSAEEDTATNTTSDNVNGEEVRGEVEYYLKRQATRTAVAGLGFFLAIVGMWGDGSTNYVSETYVSVVGV